MIRGVIAGYNLQYVMLNSDKGNVFEIGVQTTIVLYAPKLLYIFQIFRP